MEERRMEKGWREELMETPAPLLMTLPYIMTILILLFISIGRGRSVVLGAPAALGLPFDREERD